jgi:hypothetical protein
MGSWWELLLAQCWALLSAGLSGGTTFAGRLITDDKSPIRFWLTGASEYNSTYSIS